VATGVLRSAIAGVVDLAGHKRSRIDGHAHSDDPRVQQTVGDATAAAVFLSAGLGRVTEDYWSAFVDGGFPSREVRGRLWAGTFAAIDVARQQVSNLYAVATSRAYASRNPVDRALRDIHAINAWSDSVQSLRRSAGLALLGHEPSHPMF
jgi:alkylation response protein AidB-like acyl-CoA dehydrogenase